MAGALDPELVKCFAEEVRGYLPALEREVESLRSTGGTGAALDEIHRLAHSIRSASDMIGLSLLADAARGIETLVAAREERAPTLDDAMLFQIEQGLLAMKLGLDEAEPQAMEDAVTSESELPEREEVSEELLGVFLAEADEHLSNISARLQELQEETGEPAAALQEIRRSVHTLKGAAGMVGLATASRLAHGMEDVLDLVCGGRLPTAPEILELLTSTFDNLSDLVAARGDNRALRSAVSERLEQLQAIAALAAPGEAPPAEDAEPEISPREEVDPDLLDTFLAEAEQHMQEAAAALTDLRAGHEDARAPLRRLRRSVHTIKGAAGMVGLMTMSHLARRIQFLLDRVEEGERTYNGEMQSLLVAGIDILSDLIGAQGENSPYCSSVEQISRRLDDELAARPEIPAPAGAPPAPVPEPASAPASELVQFVRVPLERLEPLLRRVSELFLNASSFEQQLSSLGHDLNELSLNLARMRRLSASLEEAQAAAGQRLSRTSSANVAEPAGAAGFDVLEFDRYTQLHLLARDLAEATTDLAAVSVQMQQARGTFDGLLGRHRSASRDLQNGLMQLRMVPVSSLAARLDRTVRVSAAKIGRQAVLQMAGMSTELDKAVLEQLAGPLEHLLRNAVSHGIESPDERRRLGKQETGTLRLDAGYEGAQVFLSLEDDGAGLDYERIRRRAVELGWMSEDEVSQLDEDALSRFIFLPGFSTASVISEIAGRGVGLDVVRTAVEAMKGELTTESVAGAGTRFTIRLPLSLAVTRVLLVGVAAETCGFPLAAVSRVARVGAEELERDGGTVRLRLGETPLPVVDLAAWLGLREPAVPESGRLSFLLVPVGGRRLALYVDRLLEAREVVIKSLGGSLRRATRYAGATLLGDGSVLLVLNPAALSYEHTAVPHAGKATRSAVPARAPEVLVVDDSLSIRRAVSRLLQADGWTPLQARDGVEALEQLHRAERLPDVILMDVEMPRMDGFELIGRIRVNPDYRNIPIVMLTSRAGEKHRAKAMDLGADDYLVKPCPDDELRAALRRAATSRVRTPEAAS